ncbi:NADPH-dependent ferric siderophore reductase, contains FAD-binding and SIP domains [Rhodoblastus acidophilus]|uniref:NADPH-dependent ferric siderophore reductase, contains FAD-binding and SIP domains n=1 Tax=Rhodoblastus acidophilus TaxID=1074 RepID=A0A212R8H7_RHOAC|nr:siderophore-interacting protein [Rhodoblastus acidophilus]PPQ37931.1 siderophore-interacting protein [Rhodoblastus acidophilus]RAI24040.1 siderophore-interacting protein [Rhodoblastus acidophilus]SNB68431.1 NADPH-dependent ferric siderophore reductase, contains FAD-binding and SIP domains [Rhodoblastus acidophilus]
MLCRAETRHTVERLRQEPKKRLLTVESVARLTPSMLRLTFTSPQLADFVSHAPDDHVKLFLPDPNRPGETVLRDYTPRAFDAAGRRLTLDFALHDAGPATAWALKARPGDTLTIGGPRGSVVVADDFDYYLLIGDESALPAIGRRVESLRPGVAVASVVVVNGPEDVQTFAAAAHWTPLWVFRRGAHADDATLLRRALSGWAKPEGDGFVWIAAEAAVARRLRDYMIEDRGHPKNWIKAAGYWVRGKAGAHEKFEA